MTTRSGYDISGLAIGKPYVAILMVWREPGSPVVSATADGVTFGNPVLTTQEWTESRVTFIASAQTQRVGLFRADNKNGRTYIGGVVCTASPYTGAYFDGFSGPDFSWGGTVNDSLSYYFPDKFIRSYLISQLLTENCPWGVTPNAPQFGATPHTSWILGDSDRSILGSSTIV